MDLVTTSAVVSGLAGAVGAVVGVGVTVTRPLLDIRRQNAEQLRKQQEFAEDWYGEAARPGRTAVPGVPERLARIEAELRPNGGASLRDAIGRLEQRFEDHLRTHQST